MKSRIIIFSLFIFSGQALNVLARTLDSIIISSQSKGGLKDTAVFTVAVYLVTLMEVPMRGMTGIATSMIAQAWKDKDMKTIYELYQKTALNLLIPGLGILGLLLLNMHGAILFLGPTYKPMATVIVILGTAKIIDLGTGLNSQILLSSKHWKIDFISNMFLVFMAGIFNYLLVRKMGIIGSAYATLIAFTIYNFVRFVIIWKLFKMQPFTLENLKTIAIALICFLLCWLIPAINDLYLDVIVKSIPFMLIYGFLIIKANISKDINDLYYGAFNRIKRIF
ncbi:MAG: polysaccharide biosynthesis protein [Bacteroidetes bacterium]|nr:polysaccharide biosynthesis protein [Bacteroidota bacterium]